MNLKIILIVSLLSFGFSQLKTSMVNPTMKETRLKEIINPRVSDIPKSIIDTINSITEDFSLANPNEKFNATDAGLFGNKKPHRQLRYLASNGEHWQITYKHGGLGLHYHLVECEVTNDGIRDLKSYVTLSNLESQNDIEKVKNEKETTIRNIASTEEPDKF